MTQSRLAPSTATGAPLAIRFNLPPELAFVLRFAPEADLQRGIAVGRIEHVTSGRGRRFSSMAEATEFIQLTLAPDSSAASDRNHDDDRT